MNQGKSELSSSRRLHSHSSKDEAGDITSDKLPWTKVNKTRRKRNQSDRSTEHTVQQKNPTSRMDSATNTTSLTIPETIKMIMEKPEEYRELPPEAWWAMFVQMEKTLQSVNTQLQGLEGRSTFEDLPNSFANRLNDLEETVRKNGIQQRIMANIIINITNKSIS